MKGQLQVAIVAVVALSALAATAYGMRSLQAQDVVINGCYVPGSGSIYRVGVPGTPAACLAPRHVGFSWNTTGLPGPEGQPGVDGVSGADGVSGYEIVVSDLQSVGPNSTLTLLVACPSGKKVVGGGFSGGGRLMESRPVLPGGRWLIELHNDLANGFSVIGYAVCVTAL